MMICSRQSESEKCEIDNANWDTVEVAKPYWVPAIFLIHPESSEISKIFHSLLTFFRHCLKENFHLFSI